MKIKLKLMLFVAILTSVIFTACEKKFETNDVPPPFVGIPAPAADKGYQVHIPPFMIPAQYEREIYIRMPIGNKEEIFVNEINSRMRPGTHHMVLREYRFNDEKYLPQIGQMREQNLPNAKASFYANLSGDRILFEALTPDFDYRLPAGYALKMPANHTMDFNSHYFNKTDATRFGEIYCNFVTIPKDKVTQLVTPIECDGNEDLVLQPKEKKTFVHNFPYEKRTTVLSLLSHTHKRGVKFVIKYYGGKRNGEVLYVSEDWEHPVYLNLAKPIVFEPGEGLTSEVTYYNESDRVISFGLTSEDEMNFIFGFQF
jgi:Copper type II ascorbate-dependent monooxygenase, C-terminal domain